MTFSSRRSRCAAGSGSRRQRRTWCTGHTTTTTTPPPAHAAQKRAPSYANQSSKRTRVRMAAAESTHRAAPGFRRDSHVWFAQHDGADRDGRAQRGGWVRGGGEHVGVPVLPSVRLPAGPRPSPSAVAIPSRPPAGGAIGSARSLSRVHRRSHVLPTCTHRRPVPLPCSCCLVAAGLEYV